MRRFLAAGCLLLAAGCANLLGMSSAGAQILQPPPQRPDALMSGVTSEVIAENGQRWANKKR